MILFALPIFTRPLYGDSAMKYTAAGRSGGGEQYFANNHAISAARNSKGIITISVYTIVVISNLKRANHRN